MRAVAPSTSGPVAEPHAEQGTATLAAPRVGAPRVGEVHLWRASLHRSAQEVACLEGDLSSDERARAERFVAARDQRRFVVARGCLRRLLGRYLAVPPHALLFGYGPSGKPELAWPAPSPPLRFNLAHSGGLALYAIATGWRVGVDVEVVRPLDDLRGVSRLVFSAREREELWALPPRARQRAFFDGWVRKEAVLKALGEGLTGAPRATEVWLARHEAPLLRRLAGEAGACVRWTLSSVDVGWGHAAAVAVEGEGARLVAGSVKRFGALRR